MLTSSPTYIHFRVHWQILGPESPRQRFERETFQRFFEELNSNQELGGYDDFSYRPDRCELVKSRGVAPQGGQAFSKVVYSDDALTLVEEFTEDSVGEFSKKIKAVLGSWFRCFPQTLAVVQTCFLRALVDPGGFDDSRRFLSDGVLKLSQVFADKLDAKPHSIGFNFACQSKFGSVPMNLDATIRSWRETRSVWVEVKGSAPMDEPLNAAKHDKAEAVFGRCRNFLEKEVIPLLDEYDRGGTEQRDGESP